MLYCPYKQVKGVLKCYIVFPARFSHLSCTAHHVVQSFKLQTTLIKLPLCTNMQLAVLISGGREVNVDCCVKMQTLVAQVHLIMVLATLVV